MVQTIEGSPLLARAKNVEIYDFRRPTTLTREHSRALELALETFSRQWGTQLTAKVRVRSQVTFEHVGIHTYDEYASGLPAATTMMLLEIEGYASKAVIQFPTPTALVWFSYMLGGNGSRVEAERKFTIVEQTLVRKLIEDTIDDLRYSFGPILSEQITIDSIHHNSQFAQAAAITDLMIVATFTVQVGDHADPATLAIPAEVIFHHLGDANPVTSVADARGLIENQIAFTPVNVSLQVNPATVTPRRVLDLAVGDVIPLPHHRHNPLTLAIEGRPFGRAAVGANGSRIACVVVETQEN